MTTGVVSSEASSGGGPGTCANTSGHPARSFWERGAGVNCQDCGKPLPRRTKDGKVWAVTYADSKDEPPYWREDVPMYFTSRRAAKEYRDNLEGDPDWDGKLLAILKPDDVTFDDITWHFGCLS